MTACARAIGVRADGGTMLWRLRIENGTHFDLPMGISEIGRSRSCAICVPHPSVSREHARVVVAESATTIADCESRNGTWVDRVRLRGTITIRKAAELRVGDVELVLGPLEGTAPSSPKLVLRCARCGAELRSAICVECTDSFARRPRRSTGAHTPALLVERQRMFIEVHVELAERAMAAGRLEEAEHALERLTADHDDLANLPAELSGMVLRATLAFAVARDDGRWLRWSFERLAAAQSPPVDVLHGLPMLSPALVARALPALERLVAVLAARESALPSEVRASVTSLGEVAARARASASTAGPHA